MHVGSSSGSRFCPSPEEYETHLKDCFTSEEDNEIWCAQSEGGYPCLSILVKGEQAVVNYFAQEGGDMVASFGDENAAGSIDFCGGQYEIAAYQVIPAADAMKCALAFFQSQEIPGCIEWEEL